MENSKRRFLLGASAGLLAMTHLASKGQSRGTIRIVVGFPPGGTTDIIARLVGKELGDALGTPEIVENRPGASGIIAGGAVANAPPDGNTLLMASSTHAVAPFLYKSMPYDTDKDLVPVGLIAMTPYVLVVHPSVPATSFAELVALLKANPGKYSYASSSPGTIQHLAGETLRRATGVDIFHVAYKGTGALLPDLLSGRVPMMFENVAVMTPHIKDGAMRAIAVTSDERVPMLPEVPTLREHGLGDLQLLGAFSIWAPKGTPPAVVKKLNDAVNQIVIKPAVAKRLLDLGAAPMAGTPDKASEWVKSDQAKFGPLIKELGLSGQ